MDVWFGVHCTFLCFCTYSLQHPKHKTCHCKHLSPLPVIPCLCDSMSCQDDQASTTRPCQIKESKTFVNVDGVKSSELEWIMIKWFCWCSPWMYDMNHLTHWQYPTIYIALGNIMLWGCEWVDSDSHDREKTFLNHYQYSISFNMNQIGWHMDFQFVTPHSTPRSSWWGLATMKARESL